MEGSIIYHFMIIFQHKTILRELAAQKTRRKKRKKRGGGTAQLGEDRKNKEKKHGQCQRYTQYNLYQRDT